MARGPPLIFGDDLFAELQPTTIFTPLLYRRHPLRIDPSRGTSLVCGGPFGEFAVFDLIFIVAIAGLWIAGALLVRLCERI